MKKIILIVVSLFIIVGNLEIVFAANSSIDSELKKLIMDTENKKLNSELRREKTEILMKKLEKYLQTKESSRLFWYVMWRLSDELSNSVFRYKKRENLEAVIWNTMLRFLDYDMLKKIIHLKLNK